MIFLLGGQNSGKSRYALEMARPYAQKRGLSRFIFIATLDDTLVEQNTEIVEKIKAHQQERKAMGVPWQLLVAPRELATILCQIPPDSLVLIDCFSMLVNNILALETMPQYSRNHHLLPEKNGKKASYIKPGDASGGSSESAPSDAFRDGLPVDVLQRVQQKIELLLAEILQYSGHLFLVSLEVGLGNVAMDPLMRLYNTILGRANQRLANLAEQSYWVVAGRALPLNETKLS